MITLPREDTTDLHTLHLYLQVKIINTDRSVGGRVSGVIAKKWGNKGFAAEGGELHLIFKGSAGTSCLR
jgi:glutamate synthase domain-containing protein 3